MSSVARARISRARFVAEYPDAAGVLLMHEILRALAKYPDLRVRLNVLSDIRWELVIPNAMAYLISLGVRFYDYSKAPPRMRRPMPGYSLTYSATERMTDADVVALVRNGHNVAIVFDAAKSTVKRAALSGATWHGIPLADGLSSDDRTLDPSGVIVALAALGQARGDMSGFVRPFDVARYALAA